MTDYSSMPEKDRPLNQAYVSPWQKSDQGGLVPRGACRRGIAGLQDWQVGIALPEGTGGEEKLADEDEDDKTPRGGARRKSRL